MIKFSAETMKVREKLTYQIRNEKNNIDSLKESCRLCKLYAFD